MPDFLFSVRNIVGGQFGIDPDTTTHYLLIPDGAAGIDPVYEIARDTWAQTLIDARESREDILIFIHGYNVSDNDLWNSHNVIKKGLQRQGYTGQVVSFDWPCGDNAAVYLEDRHKAALTAMQLVDGGIALLAETQNKAALQGHPCTVNIHLLAHSTGALVVREAFEDAQNANKLKTQDWMVSQLVFISGDISSNSMNLHSKCDAIYDHTTRFTNFYNPYDKVLALSNAKRLGFENRVGRVGLPDNVPSKCVDVNSGFYYDGINNHNKRHDPVGYSHSWYFDPDVNGEFMKDLCLNIQGDIDRSVFPTRELVDGVLRLV